MHRATRQPRPRAAGLMLGALLVSLGLAWMISAWFLVAGPFALGASYAMWLGLSNGEALDAFSTLDDAGIGTAGMSP